MDQDQQQQPAPTAPQTPAPEPRKRRGRPPGSKTLNIEVLARVLAEVNGNIPAAAEVLGVSVTTVEYHISHDLRLKSLYASPKGLAEVQVGEVEAMTRGRSDAPPAFAPAKQDGDAVLADVVQIQDEELIIQGLKKVGISDEMVEKLRNISALGPTAGRFMASSLALTHKLMVVQTIELKVEADYIREHYLRDEKLSAEERSYWQKSFNEIADLIGKGFDRTLAGTQALIAMQRGAAGKGRPAKQGPQPLNTKPVLPT